MNPSNLDRPSTRSPALMLALTIAASAATLPAAAATLDLSWSHPERFTDIGRGDVDRDRRLAALAAHFEQLARRLPAAQALTIEVLDVDLAGEIEPTGTRQLRFVRDRADWPRMTLRYSLADGGRTVASGVARLSDLNYLHSTLDQTRRDDDLVYEKRMVDRWFDKTFPGH